MQGGLLMIILINGLRNVRDDLVGGPQAAVHPLSPAAGFGFPRVSIHVPICKEPPEMVKETLNSLAALNYPNYEVLVIDNNNPHPELWQPVQAHCESLGRAVPFLSSGDPPGLQGRRAQLRPEAHRSGR